MNKFFILLIVLAFGNNSLRGQAKTIAIPAFIAKGPIIEQSKTLFENAFDRAAKSQNRFKVLEREQLKAIEEERQRQKSDSYIDATIAEQGKALGADYMVIGEVQGYDIFDSFIPAMDKDPAGRLVKITLLMNARVIATATGEVVFIHQQQLMQRAEFVEKSPGFKQLLSQIEPDLVDKLAKRYENYANGFLCQALPPDIQILELAKTSGKKASNVTIGTTAALRDNTILEVYREEMVEVDGEEIARKISVGELVFEKMEGEKIGHCDVRDGGKEILSLFNSGTKLKCAVKGWKIKFLFSEVDSFEVAY